MKMRRKTIELWGGPLDGRRIVIDYDADADADPNEDDDMTCLRCGGKHGQPPLEEGDARTTYEHKGKTNKDGVEVWEYQGTVVGGDS